MNWEKVAKYLDDEGWAIRKRADAGFPNDPETRREMWTRASIFITLGEALSYGARRTENIASAGDGEAD